MDGAGNRTLAGQVARVRAWACVWQGNRWDLTVAGSIAAGLVVYGSLRDVAHRACRKGSGIMSLGVVGLARLSVLLSVLILLAGLVAFGGGICYNCFGNGAMVKASAADEPVNQGKQQDEYQEHAGVVHLRWSAKRAQDATAVTYVVRSDGALRRQNEDDADKQRPQTGPGVDRVAEDAHMPGSGPELAKHEFAQNGNAITPVEGDGAKGENGIDCSV